MSAIAHMPLFVMYCISQMDVTDAIQNEELIENQQQVETKLLLLFSTHGILQAQERV